MTLPRDKRANLSHTHIYRKIKIKSYTRIKHIYLSFLTTIQVNEEFLVWVDF